MSDPNSSIQGILLVNKPQGKTAFSLVATLRRLLGIRKIGHAGTLDPFATGVMVMLVGKNATRLSNQFLCADKEYRAQLHLGISTNTFDREGEIVRRSEIIPTLTDIEQAIEKFQGEVMQVPPMFSAKKIHGKKLYELARAGKTIERPAAKVQISLRLLNYVYPYLDVEVKCSKGTYIRSLAEDIGIALGCGAHLSYLQRTRSGTFHLEECVDGEKLGEIDDLHAKIRSIC